MPLYVVRSAPVRSPEPATPIQCTSGQVGSAPAVPADKPTSAALATAAALVSAEIRRTINPNPIYRGPTWTFALFIGSAVACVTAAVAPRSTKWLGLLALSSQFVRLGRKAHKRKRRPPRGERRFAVLLDHLTILVTRPAPTVRPPSRIAKRRPSSMATGWISLTEM